MKIYVDYKKWEYPQYKYGQKKTLTIDVLNKSGIHSFASGVSGLSLDFLSLGFGKEYANSKSFLVVFNGAVGETTRATAVAPFFSGTGLSNLMKMPLLAVADPTLALDDRITLAWYAGNHHVKDIYESIASAIDSIATKTGRTPIFVGGSGGGYAAIQTISRTKHSGSCVVWNPQTSIGAYYMEAGLRYITTAFPNLIVPPESTVTSKAFQDFLDTTLGHLPHRLPNISTLAAHHKIIYMQNVSDTSHMSRHAGPWLNQGKFASINEKSFLNDAGNVLFFPGDWGTGHVSPPIQYLTDLISLLSKGSSLGYIAADHFTKSAGALTKRLNWFAVYPPNGSTLQLTHQRQGQDLKLEANPIPKFGTPDDFEYAFYIYSANKRLAQSWYKKSNSIKFEGIPESGDLTVHVYLKDRLGSVKAISKRLH